MGQLYGCMTSGVHQMENVIDPGRERVHVGTPVRRPAHVFQRHLFASIENDFGIARFRYPYADGAIAFASAGLKGERAAHRRNHDCHTLEISRLRVQAAPGETRGNRLDTRYAHDEHVQRNHRAMAPQISAVGKRFPVFSDRIVQDHGIHDCPALPEIAEHNVRATSSRQSPIAPTGIRRIR